MTGKFPQFRIGNGYDIHRLVKGRDLIIAGVKLQHPDNLGLDGHSDADVLSHSIMDALLGALSLGDIGKYFPPSDEKWKNADSLFLLSKVIDLIRKDGWEINNIDSVLIAERPKIMPHIKLMKKNISEILNIDENLISFFHKKYYRMTTDAFFSSFWSQLFICSCFNPNQTFINIQGLRNIFFHYLNMWHNFWPFSNKNTINIVYFPTILSY